LTAPTTANVGLADMARILGTVVSTPATAGILDVNVKNMNNVAGTAITTIKAVQGLTTADTIATYTGNTVQTGDSFARLGTPAGASIEADIAAINAKTTNLPAAPASTTNISAGTITTVSGNVNGSVASVTAGVIVTTNNDKTGYTASTVSDKTGYALVAGYDPAKTASQAGDAMALTTGERTTLTAAIWAQVIETGYTAIQTLRLIAASVVGKLSGAATTSIVIRDLNDTKDRITATVDSDGNRTVVTKDVS
jgi:hypothetical protein